MKLYMSLRPWSHPHDMKRDRSNTNVRPHLCALLVAHVVHNFRDRDAGKWRVHPQQGEQNVYRISM